MYTYGSNQQTLQVLTPAATARPQVISTASMVHGAVAAGPHGIYLQYANQPGPASTASTAAAAPRVVYATQQQPTYPAMMTAPYPPAMAAYAPHLPAYAPHLPAYAVRTNQRRARNPMAGYPMYAPGYPLAMPAQRLATRQQMSRKPESHIILSCMVYLCCNFVFGTVAFALSMLSQNAAAELDYPAARDRGKQACYVSIAGITCTLVTIVLLVILQWVAGMALLERMGIW